MKPFIALSEFFDRLSFYAGRLANGTILLACVVSASNALSRYGFDISDNWPLELQWYFFAAAVMLGAPYTFQRNEHVRVDLVYAHVSEKTRHWIDILGIVIFLLPGCLFFAYLSWNSLFLPSWQILEQSNNAGGLPRYPIKLVLPIGFTLLAMQGTSELIKRVAALRGYQVMESRYERPVQ